MRHLPLLLLLAIGLLTACSKFSRVQKKGTVQEKLQAAFEYFENEDYYKANTLLQEVYPIIRGQKEAEKALYYYAYSAYELNDLQMGAYYFKRFYQTYPRSKWAENARYLRAKALFHDSPPYNLDQTSTKKAISAFQTYINRYPESNRKPKVNAYMADLRQKLEKKAYESATLYQQIYDYKAAMVAYENFLEEYPDSKYVEDIMFRQVETAFQLAENSVKEKQQERYRKVIDHYHNYVDNFEDADQIKKATQYFESAREDLKKLRKKS